MWTDEGQEEAVARRQGRLQQRVDAAADLPVESPDKLLEASHALANLPPEALLEDPARPAERAAEQRRRWVEEWKQEHEELRLHQHRSLGRVSAKGLTEMETRLEKGEPMVDEKGTIIGYRPIRTRDLDNIIATAIDKQLVIEKRILGEEGGNRSPTVTPKTEELLIRLELVSRERPLAGEVRGEFREPKVIDAEATD